MPGSSADCWAAIRPLFGGEAVTSFGVNASCRTYAVSLALLFCR